MKKLMVALAAVALAFASQAAVTKWGTSAAVKIGTTIQSGITCQLYMVGVSGQKDALMSTRTTGSAGMTNGKLASAAGTDQTVEWGDTLGGGAIAGAREIYMVLTGEAGGKEYTYTTDTMTLTAAGATSSELGNAIWTIGTETSTEAGAKNVWVYEDVPEPTSGLLLLIGMAGLALRRRRA